MRTALKTRNGVTDEESGNGSGNGSRESRAVDVASLFSDRGLYERIKRTGSYIVDQEFDTISSKIDEANRKSTEVVNYSVSSSRKAMVEVRNRLGEIRGIGREIARNLRAIDGNLLASLMRKVYNDTRELDELIAVEVEVGTDIISNFGLIAGNNGAALQGLIAYRASLSGGIDTLNYWVGVGDAEIDNHTRILEGVEKELGGKSEAEDGFYRMCEIRDQTLHEIGQINASVTDNKRRKDGHKERRSALEREIQLFTEAKACAARVHHEAEDALRDFSERAPKRLQLIYQGIAGRDLREALNVIGNTSSVLEEKAITGYNILRNLTGNLVEKVRVCDRGIVRL
ncbi:MAG: hypothetical protein AABW87_01765 [Nanoarchaeota archaeon]